MTTAIERASAEHQTVSLFRQPLRLAAVVFAGAFSLHTFDHLRRGTSTLTTLLQWAGNVSSVISIAVIVAVLTNRRWAPAAATIAGFSLAIGFAAAHLLPTWSDLSDSFPDQNAAVFSWFAAIAEISTAAALGAVGLTTWRGLIAAVPSSTTHPRPGDR